MSEKKQNLMAQGEAEIEVFDFDIADRLVHNFVNSVTPDRYLMYLRVLKVRSLVEGDM